MIPPTTHPQRLQRRHSDPPALWVTLILSSFFIHIVAFWLLRLLMMGNFPGWQSRQDPIPVDVIAITPEARSRTQGIQPPNTATPRQPSSVNNAIKTPSDQPLNRQSSSTSTESSNRANIQQPSRQSSATNPLPNQSSPPNSSPKPPSDNSSQQTPPNSSQQTPPNSSQNQSPDQSQEPTSPSSQAGGIRANLGGLRLTDASRDVPDQEAKLKSDSRREFSIDYLTQLGINPDQAVVLKVKVLIDDRGQPSLLPGFTQVLSGNISTDKAEQLAKQIIEEWRFEPTYMGNSPVEQAYNLELRITPSSS